MSPPDPIEYPMICITEYIDAPAQSGSLLSSYIFAGSPGCFPAPDAIRSEVEATRNSGQLRHAAPFSGHWRSREDMGGHGLPVLRYFYFRQV